MSYSPYPAYKDSSVPWLGQVPEGWDVWKVSHGFRIVGSGTTPRSDNPNYYDGDVPWVTTSELREKDIFDTKKKLTDAAIKDHSALKLFSENALIIAMYGATIGRLGRLKTKATVNQACCVFDNPKAFDSRFVFWWFQMAKPVLISEASGGGQPNLSQEFLKQVRIPVPAVEEQTSIADFLDKKTAKIDDLIAKKEELLRLLAEQRTALITHAVTKGLNPNTPMKPSGIDWLGDVPEGWETSRIDFQCTVKARLGWKGLTASEYVDEGFVFLATPNIKGRKIDFDNVNYINEQRYLESPEIMIEPGDILLAKDGSTLGTINLVRTLPRPATVNSSIAIIRPRHKNIDSAFLYRWLEADVIQSKIQKMKDGQGVPHLFQSDIRKFFLPLPPLSEQAAIAKFLDRELDKVDMTIEKATDAVVHLREYRTALITNAVTGKIKVA